MILTFLLLSLFDLYGMGHCWSGRHLLDGSGD